MKNDKNRLLTLAALGFAGFGLLAASTSSFAYAIDEKKPEASKPQDDKKPDDKKPEAKTPDAKEEGKKDADKKEAKDGDKKADKKAEKPKKPKKTKYQKATEKADKFEGLFTFFLDPKTNKVFMEITEDQLGKEFIYHSHVENGVLNVGFRGAYRQEKLIRIEKKHGKIRFVHVPTQYYFDPDNAISKAAEANVSESILAAVKVHDEGPDKEKKSYLIAADGLFKGETFGRLRPIRFPGPGAFFQYNPGKISPSKSSIDSIKAYPENAYVTTDYVFSNPNGFIGGPGITDPRNVTMKLQHTFLAVPENDYKPRFDDQRVGYFLSGQTSQTDTSVTPYRDMINRWHLVKKDPSAELSEPVEPIVWWIENTTPEEWRPIIKKAGEAWNVAFEAAGFKNAVQVKVQPDDADWDAGDIRYNVLRWTASPVPPFSGYGPSFANPKTGQLLGADIMLEYAFLRNRLLQGETFDKAALANIDPVPSDAESIRRMQLEHAFNEHAKHCNLANHLHMNNMVGAAFAATDGYGDDVNKELVEQSMYYLILHEIGHTLGLNHNMKATQARSYETAHNKAAQTDGLVGSVMDYPTINYAPEGKEQAYYYTTSPGAYDKWAIQFGYDPDLDDPEKRAAHLAKSLDPELAFGNDADDMRAPGRGIDPRVNVGDFSDDAIQYAADRLAMDRRALDRLEENFVSDGDSFQKLRNAYLIVTSDMFSQAATVTRYVGGVYVDRMVAGQKTPDGKELDPYRPVEAERQKEAMKLLADNIFAPDAFTLKPSTARKLSIQRRGYAHGGGTEDPKIHSRAIAIQGSALAHLLHPRTLLRINDSQNYGNSYSIDQVMGDLTDAIFAADQRGSVNTFRQQLQIFYVNRLIGVIGAASPYDFVSRSNALANLRSIRKLASRSKSAGNAGTKAHRDHIILLIDKALEVYKG